MIDPIDEYSMPQPKGLDGKKLKTTAKEGLDIADEDEKSLGNIDLASAFVMVSGKQAAASFLISRALMSKEEAGGDEGRV